MKNKNLFMPMLTLCLVLIPFEKIMMRGSIVMLLLALLTVFAFFLNFHTKGKIGFSDVCVDAVFYGGSIVLVLYLVEMLISSGMFPIFDVLSDSAAFTNMLALWIISIAAVKYIYSKSSRLDMNYILAGIIAELTLAVNCEWGALFLMLMLIFGAAIIINPIAEHMKRALQLLIGSAFILCNMSLLFGYVDWINAEGIEYSLETSVAGELMLCIFALYVLHEWDKIPENAVYERVRLCTLQRNLRRIFIGVLAVAAVAAFLCYDMGGTEIQVIFTNVDGESETAGIFVNTLVSLMNQAYGAFVSAADNNIVGMGYQYGGLGVALLANIFFVGAVWLCYRGYKDGFGGEKLFAMITVVELIQLLCIPIAWELLPLYILFMYPALRRYVPSKKEIKDCFAKLRNCIRKKDSENVGA